MPGSVMLLCQEVPRELSLSCPALLVRPEVVCAAHSVSTSSPFGLERRVEDEAPPVLDRAHPWASMRV